MRKTGLTAATGALALLCLGSWVSSVLAASLPTVEPTVAAGYTIGELAAAPRATRGCDDLAFLEGHLFLACQNKTLASGGGGKSTLAEYTATGALVSTWSIKDKIDGMGADPLHHRLIVTENEDANSHLFTLTPSAPRAQQIARYTYSPDPSDANAPAALHTGGGTDQVTVDIAGHILVTASNGRRRASTAVFKVVLSPSSRPGRAGTATLSSTFLNNATASNGNTGTGSIKLHLSNVDSGAIVPKSSPRFGGSYVIVDQSANELVFCNDIFTGTGLTVLTPPFSLDDMRWASSDNGTLYIVNTVDAVRGGSAIYKVTGPFKKDTVLASNDTVEGRVDILNLATGALTPFVSGLTKATGLAYLDASGTQTELPLNGASEATTATTTRNG